jgi:formylglycine-generating enzyme required for sulfatase activity
MKGPDITLLRLAVLTLLGGLLVLSLLPSAAMAAGCGPDVDEARWQTAQVEGTPARLRDYLQACPNGRHAGQARARLAHVSEPWEPEMVVVRGGCFLMGSAKGDPASDRDERQHEVCVKDFEIARYEVTFDEYDRFVAATGRESRLPPADRGRVGVRLSQRRSAAALLRCRPRQPARLLRRQLPWSRPPGRQPAGERSRNPRHEWQRRRVDLLVLRPALPWQRAALRKAR